VQGPSALAVIGERKQGLGCDWREEAAIGRKHGERERERESEQKGEK
jgi:hypothetical protein